MAKRNRGADAKARALPVYSRMHATKNGMQRLRMPGSASWLSHAISSAVWKPTRPWHVKRHAAKLCWSFASSTKKVRSSATSSRLALCAAVSIASTKSESFVAMCTALRHLRFFL
jgi:hypothetical protein